MFDVLSWRLVEIERVVEVKLSEWLFDLVEGWLKVLFEDMH